MFKRLFSDEQQASPKTVQVTTNPQIGIAAPSPEVMLQWLEQDTEVIDLGAPRRDQAILPTTWHKP